jgi:hypothetical protein
MRCVQNSQGDLIPVRTHLVQLTFIASLILPITAFAITFVKPIPEVRLAEVAVSVGSKTTKATPNASGTADPKYLGSVTTFSDEHFDFSANLTSHGLLLVLKNKSGQTAKVMWEEGAFVDEKNATHPLRHESEAAAEERGKRAYEALMRSIQRGDNSRTPKQSIGESSPTSVLISGTELSEWVEPADLVGDTKRFLFPTSDSASDVAGESVAQVRVAVEEKVGQATGNQYRYLIPISVGGERRDYLFTFIYEGADITVESR